MLTEVETTRRPAIPEDIEEAEYPPEVIARWDAQFETIKLKLATGELVPKSVEDLATELGFDIDFDLDDEDGYA